MNDSNTIPQSLIEQIASELAIRLKDREGFDTNLIDKIREFAGNGELKKRAKLVSLLKPEGVGNETA